MQALFYNLLIGASKFFGTWIFSLGSRMVAAVYFLCSPRRRAVGRRFYGILFPEKSPAQLNYCTWKQYQSFTHVFLDRHIQRHTDALQYTKAGGEHLLSAREHGKGVILLMSHMGNWEVAAYGLKKINADLEMMLLMGIRNKEAIEKIQKTSTHKDGIRVIGIDEQGGSPFDIVEAVRFLRQGGIVSMTGDRLWRPDQRSVQVSFLGRRMQLPEAPYALALATGAPILVFFAFRLSARRYHISALAPIRVEAGTRGQRQAAIDQAAQQYATYLEQALRDYPYEWFHFDEVLGPIADKTLDRIAK